MNENDIQELSQCLKFRNYGKWAAFRDKVKVAIGKNDKLLCDDLFEKCFPSIFQYIYENNWEDELLCDVYKDCIEFTKTAIFENYFAFQYYFYQILSDFNTTKIKIEIKNKIRGSMIMNNTIIQSYCDFLGNGYYIDHAIKFYKEISYPDVKYQSPFFGAISQYSNNAVASKIASNLLQSKNQHFLREYQRFFMSQGHQYYYNYVYIPMSYLSKEDFKQLDFFVKSIDIELLPVTHKIDLIFSVVNEENIETNYVQLQKIEKQNIPPNVLPLFYKLMEKFINLCLSQNLPSGNSSITNSIIHNIIDYLSAKKLLPYYIPQILGILGSDNVTLSKDELLLLVLSIGDPFTEIDVLEYRFMNNQIEKSSTLSCILEYCQIKENFLDIKSMFPSIRRKDNLSTDKFKKIDVKINEELCSLKVSPNIPKDALENYLSFLCDRKIVGIDQNAHEFIIDLDKFDLLKFDKKYLIPTLAFSTSDTFSELIRLKKFDNTKKEATKLLEYLILPQIDLKKAGDDLILYYFKNVDLQNASYLDLSPLMDKKHILQKILPIIFEKCDMCSNENVIMQMTDFAMKTFRIDGNLQQYSIDLMKKHFNLLSEATFLNIIKSVKFFPNLLPLIEKMSDIHPDSLVSAVRHILRKESLIVGISEISSLLESMFIDWFIEMNPSSTLDRVLLLQALRIHQCPSNYAEALEEHGLNASSYLERRLCFEIASTSQDYNFEFTQSLLSDMDVSNYCTYNYGSRDHVATGVRNPNQLCYMTSALTLLAYNQEFLQMMSEVDIQDEATISFRDIIQNIAHSDNAQIELDSFIKTWKWKGTLVSKNVQQDIAEFFSHLLGSLPQEASDLFKIKTKHMESVTDQFVLEVPVSTVETMYGTLNQALDDLMKDISIESAPKNLLINLMRVQYTEKFIIPENLDIGGKHYVLNGAIGRYHTTTENGHYISFVRLGWKWLNFNDGISRELKHEDAINILSGNSKAEAASKQFPDGPAAVLWYHEKDLQDINFENFNGNYEPKSFAFPAIRNIGKNQNQNIGVLYFFNVACLSNDVLDVSDAYFTITKDISDDVINKILFDQAEVICMSILSHMIVSSNTTVMIYGMLSQLLKRANTDQMHNFYSELSSHLEDLYEKFGSFDSCPDEDTIDDIFDSLYITNESKKRTFINNKETLQSLIEKSGLLPLFIISAIHTRGTYQSDLILMLLRCNNKESSFESISAIYPKFKLMVSELLKDESIYSKLDSDRLAKLCTDFGLDLMSLIPINYLAGNIKSPENFLFSIWDNWETLQKSEDDNKILKTLISKLSSASASAKSIIKKNAGQSEGRFALYAICTVAPPDELFSPVMHKYMDFIMKYLFNNYILKIDYICTLIESNSFGYFINYLNDEEFLETCHCIVLSNATDCNHENIKILSKRLILIIFDRFTKGESLNQFSGYLANNLFNRLNVDPSDFIQDIDLDKVSERLKVRENLQLFNMLKWLWTKDPRPFHKKSTTVLAQLAKDEPGQLARIFIYYICKEVFDEEAAAVYQLSRSKTNLAVIDECFSVSANKTLYASSFIWNVLPKTTLDPMEMDLFDKMMKASGINPNDLVYVVDNMTYDNTNPINFLKKYGAIF